MLVLRFDSIRIEMLKLILFGLCKHFWICVTLLKLTISKIIVNCFKWQLFQQFRYFHFFTPFNITNVIYFTLHDFNT